MTAADRWSLGAAAAADAADPVAEAKRKTLAFVYRRIQEATEGVDDRTLCEIGDDIAALAEEGRRAELERMSDAALYERKAELGRRTFEIEAQRCEVEEVLCKRQGNEPWAAVARCQAVAYRTNKPEAWAAAEEAYAHARATDHLKAGTTPAPRDYRAADIIAAMQRIAP